MGLRFGLSVATLRVARSSFRFGVKTLAGLHPSTTPSADFWSCDHNFLRSRQSESLQHGNSSRTHARPPRLSRSTFVTHSPDLQHRSLMDGGLRHCSANSSHLHCLLSDSCSSSRDFAPRFLRTPPRDDALAFHSSFTSIKLDRELAPPS